MLKSIQFYNEAIHGVNFNLGAPVAYLHGNVGDRVKVALEFDTLLQTISDSSNGFTYDLATKRIDRATGSFFDDGFYPGQSVEFLEIGGAGQRQEATLTFVDDLFLTFTITAGTMTDGLYDGSANGIMQITTTENLTGIVYRFGVIENNEGVNYLSKYNGRVNEWKGYNMLPNSTVSLTTKTGAHEDGSITAKYVSNTNGTHTIRVEHIFTIPPGYLDEFAQNLEAGTVPSLFITQNSLKYVFQAELRFDNNNPNNLLTEEFSKYKGSVGWYNEELDSNNPDFTIDSVVYHDQNSSDIFDTLKPDKTNTVVVEVTGVFNSNTSFIAKILTTRGGAAYQNSNDSFADTFLYDSVGTVGGNTGAGTGILQGIDVTINSGTSATVRITVAYTAPQIASIDFEQEKYLLALSFADQSLPLTSSNKCTMLVGYEAYQFTTDILDLLTWNSLEAFAHNDIVTGKTSYRGWPQDGVRIEWEAELVADATLTGLRYEVTALHADGRRFTINQYIADLGNPPSDSAGVQHFDIDTTRGFNLAAADPFNEVSLVTSSASPFTLQGVVGLKVGWQSWLKNDDVDTVFIDTTKPQNNLNRLASNYEAQGFKLYLAVIAEISTGGIATDYAKLIELDSYAYGLDANATPEWAGSVKICDTSEVETGVFDRTGYNHIVATFTPVGGVTTPYNDPVVVIRLQKANEPGEAIYELSSLRATYTGNRLVPLTGQTLTQIVDNGSTIVGKCRVDGRLLEAGATYNVSARLWHTYDGIITPVFLITTVAYLGSGEFELPIVALDGAAAPLPAGRQVTMRVEFDSVVQETITGNTGQDISNFATTHPTPSNSIVGFATGEVTNALDLTFDKLAWATQNNKLNANAKSVWIYSQVMDRGTLSVEDDAEVPVVTTAGKGFPWDIEFITNTKLAFADNLKGVRTLNSDLYTELLGTLVDAKTVAVDRNDVTNPVIYATDGTAALRFWDNTNRFDLGQSGTPQIRLNETFNITSVHVNNDKVNAGFADVWLTGAVSVSLRWRNGLAWSKVNFAAKIAALSATVVCQSVCVDANGIVWVLGNVPSSGSMVIKLEKTGGGFYYDVNQWTASIEMDNNGVGFVDGDSATALFSGDCTKIIVVGYDQVVGDTTGLSPVFLIADYGNDCYRYLNKPTLNYEITTNAYFCGTDATDVYTFGAAGTDIEVGSVRGMCFRSAGATGILYGCGEGTPDRIIFKVIDWANAATQIGDSLFEGTTGYLEQTAF